MKPILFNTEMVRAILEGRKMVTRRAVKPNYRDNEIGFNVITNALTGEYVRIEYFDEWENETRYMPEPYHPGDILYVRETYRENEFPWDDEDYIYKADEHPADWNMHKWRPSIHMPREVARIFLRVTGVQMERLQTIMYDPPGPENQIVKEGCKYGCDFIAAWESTIKPADRALYGWDANPWVWVIEFERISKEEAVKNEKTDTNKRSCRI